jgi:hypothetical protein
MRPGNFSIAFATAALSPAMSAIFTPAASMRSIMRSRFVPLWNSSSMP